MVDQCDNCKFYRPRTYTLSGLPPETIYECRFSDPVARGSVSVWPRVEATDWCGKWVAIGATAGREYQGSASGGGSRVAGGIDGS